jgi:predicted XRE-type DNA-binding protein
MSSAKRRLAVGAAGLAVLAGSGGAYAAAQQNSPTTRPDPAAEQKAFLDDLAKRLNVTRDKLDEALKGAASDRIDAAVAAGQLTQAQGDEAKKRIASGANGVPIPGFRGGPGPGGHGPGGPGGLRFGFGGGMSLSAAAKFLGLTDDALRTQLQSGKSLADVAKAQSKDVAGLQDAIVADAKADLDKAVSAKKLTQAQADDILEGLRSHVSDLVNGKLPDGPKFGHRGPGPDGPGWF